MLTKVYDVPEYHDLAFDFVETARRNGTPREGHVPVALRPPVGADRHRNLPARRRRRW
jgi:hypothetical protein